MKINFWVTSLIQLDNRLDFIFLQEQIGPQLEICDAIIVMNSITNWNSLHVARESLEDLANLGAITCPVLFTANKLDLHHHRKVMSFSKSDLGIIHYWKSRLVLRKVETFVGLLPLTSLRFMKYLSPIVLRTSWGYSQDWFNLYDKPR